MNRAERQRFQQIEASWMRVSSAGFQGIDCRESANRLSFYQDYQLYDSHEQREADLQTIGDDDASGTAYKDWCTGARLRHAAADPDAGVKYLREIRDFESDDSIEKQIHSAIYRTEKQEVNRHDRFMVDVTKDGRRKGGTHGLPPELRRTRSAKIVNEQLLTWNCSEEECRETEEFNAAVSERINRKREYALSQYHSKYRDVLSLFLQGLPTKEIAGKVGKTTRRIRQLINGNAGRNAPGLRQFIAELCEQPPPLIDISASAPIVAVVGVRHAC